MEGRANKLALETDLHLGLLCGWALRTKAGVGWRTPRRKGLRKGAQLSVEWRDPLRNKPSGLKPRLLTLHSGRPPVILAFPVQVLKRREDWG